MLGGGDWKPSLFKWEIQHLLKSMGFDAGSRLGGVDEKSPQLSPNQPRWAAPAVLSGDSWPSRYAKFLWMTSWSWENSKSHSFFLFQAIAILIHGISDLELNIAQVPIWSHTFDNRSILHDIDWFKGSVERSLLPRAIFLIFTRNRPWKSEDHLCTLFFIEVSKERLEKSERTPPVSWRPWALAYSRDRPYNFSCLSAVSKNRRFSSFFLDFGVSFGEKKLLVTSNASF